MSIRKRFLFYSLVIILFLSQTLSVMAATPEMPVPDGAGAVLAEATSSQVFRQQSSDTQYQPYGLINLLISLTALRHARLTDIVTVPIGMDAVLPSEAYVIYLEEGEQLSIENCIGALLFNSANDAAYTLAVGLAGSVDTFVEWMNETAAECGAVHSHFVSVFDTENTEQYTTALDLSRIASAFWQEPALSNLLSSELYSIGPTNLTSETRYYANPFKMLEPGTSYYYEYASGGKSSRNAIAAFAHTESMTLVSIVLGASDSDAAYKASEKILEYGFDYFQPVTIEYTGESIARIPVYDQGEKIGYADAVVKGPLLFYAEVLSRKPTDPEGLESFFSHTLQLPESLQAPVMAGEKIGEVVYTRLDDPTVQIHLDCVAGDTIHAVEESADNTETSSGSLAQYLSWLNWLLLLVILILGWKLLGPIIQKTRHKPKPF